MSQESISHRSYVRMRSEMNTRGGKGAKRAFLIAFKQECNKK